MQVVPTGVFKGTGLEYNHAGHVNADSRDPDLLYQNLFGMEPLNLHVNQRAG